MSLKGFVNSRSGRAGMLVALLGLSALGIAAGFLWVLLYLPTQGSSILSENAVEQGSREFASASLLEEESPLSGLPSSILSIEDTFAEEIPGNIFDFTQKAVDNSPKESLVNAHLFRAVKDEAVKGMSYDFKFFSSRLDDYAEDGEFIRATRQFNALANLGVEELTFHSQPLSSGGRELTISLSSSVTFDRSSQLEFKNSWDKLLKSLGELVDFDKGTRVSVSFQDKSGALKLSTVLNNNESIDRGLALAPELWETFFLYLNSSSYKFLSAYALEFSLERTNEDSVLIVRMGDDATDADALEKAIWNVAKRGDDIALFPGSYITYLFAANSTSPLVTFNSSSRNW